MGGKPVNHRSLTSRLARLGAGATVELDVLREGKKIELELTLGKRPRG